METNISVEQWKHSSVTSTFTSTSSTSSGFAIVSAPVKPRKPTRLRSKLHPMAFEPPPDYDDDDDDFNNAAPMTRADIQRTQTVQKEREALLQSQPKTRQDNPNGRKFRNESSASTKPLFSRTSESERSSIANGSPTCKTVLRFEPGRHDISIEITNDMHSPKSLNSDNPFIVKNNGNHHKRCCTLPVKIMAVILVVVILVVVIYLVIHFTTCIGGVTAKCNDE